MGSTGTESKGQRTRLRILQAARRTFAEVGYERATIRQIAAAADVDKSSVIQYFGNKQALFDEAVEWNAPVAALASDDPDQTAADYLRALLAGWSADPDGPMAVLLRTAMTSADAADRLRTLLTEQIIDVVAPTIAAPDARVRAALLTAVLMGLASQRFLLQQPDLVAASDEEIVALLTPALRALLDGAAG